MIAVGVVCGCACCVCACVLVRFMCVLLVFDVDTRPFLQVMVIVEH